MSTNAVVIKQLDNGMYKGVGVTWDGDLDVTGRILSTKYSDAKDADRLVNLGDLSTLGVSLQTAPVVKKYGFDYHASEGFRKLPQSKQLALSRQLTQKHFTNAYHRDRHEPLHFTYWKSYKDVIDSLHDANDSRIEPLFDEYVYVFHNDEWRVVYSDEFGPKAMPLNVAIQRAGFTVSEND